MGEASPPHGLWGEGKYTPHPWGGQLGDLPQWVGLLGWVGLYGTGWAGWTSCDTGRGGAMQGQGPGLSQDTQVLCPGPRAELRVGPGRLASLQLCGGTRTLEPPAHPQT